MASRLRKAAPRRGARTALTVAATLAAAQALAACGSGSEGSAAPAVSSAAAAASSAASSAAAAMSSAAAKATAAAAPAAASGEFCQVVQRQKAVLAGQDLAALLGGGAPAAWRAYLARVTTMNTQLVQTAPAEIKPSVQVLQQGTLELKAQLEAAGYDISKVRVTTLLASMRSPERVRATTSLTAYVRTSCGISLDLPSS